MTTNAFRSGLAVMLVLLLGAGCAYRLGSTLPPGIETINVPAVINQTDEPQLESEVTRALVGELQRDGTLKLADAASANARLEVTLVGFKLDPLRYERDSTKTAREYRMLIDADVIMFKSDSSTPMLTRHVQGEATFDFIGDMATSKAQALPEATRDLAHDIVEALVEYW